MNFSSRSSDALHEVGGPRRRVATAAAMRIQIGAKVVAAALPDETLG